MDLGERIKNLRKSRDYTVRQVSAMANITPSLLSQIENNKVNPSINTLKALAQAMKIPMGIFFEEPVPEEYPVVQKDNRKKMQTGSGVTFFLLTPKVSGHKIEFLYNEFEPAGSTGELYQHQGEECGLVLEGSLRVIYDGKTFILNEGDSIILDSSRPHKTENASDGITKAIWVNTPPTW